MTVLFNNPFSLASLLVAATLSVTLPPTARADDAKAILAAMSDYLAAQKSVSFDYESAVEVVTPDFEKLQFVSSGSATIERPDKMRVSRKGGFADLDLSFDGNKLIVHGKNLEAFAEVDAKGSLDDLFDQLSESGIGAPGADLFLSNAFQTLMQDVTDSKHVASAVVGGVDCEYLAFRTPDVDWQVWVASGDKPVPLRYVVTTKHVGQAPQYTLEIRNFKTGSDVAKASFKIEMPKDGQVLDLSRMEGLNEIPEPSSGEGGQK